MNIPRRDVLRGIVHSLTVLPATFALGCGGASDCSDTSTLSPADAKMRTDQNYLETSPDPQKLCSLCEQFVPPEKSGCGSCKVLKGTVNPKGSCNLFVKKA